MSYQTIEVHNSTPHIGAKSVAWTCPIRSGTSNSRRYMTRSWTAW
jgi:hypothetical protein